MNILDKLQLLEANATPLPLPTAAVLIPTYRRPEDLKKCLDGLLLQLHSPTEVIVVTRKAEDPQTWELLQTYLERLPLTIVEVIVPGQVQAINTGLAHVRSEIVAITDDDAVPHRDWLQKIVELFAQYPQMAGVGGRDIIHSGDHILGGQSATVGKIPRIGRMQGNHHQGFGAPRLVDMLKGVNGSYRTAAILAHQPDMRLRGKGAQVHWEVGIGLRMRAAGLKLLYDPSVVVDHYPAQRFDEDQRLTFNALAQKNAAFNEFFLRFEYLTPLERIAHSLWATSIGTRACPGLFQCVRLFPTRKTLVFRQFGATVAGLLEAWKCL